MQTWWHVLYLITGNFVPWTNKTIDFLLLNTNKELIRNGRPQTSPQDVLHFMIQLSLQYIVVL